jgi:hypothetical protein
MEHLIKTLSENIGNAQLKKLVASHVKELLLENGHLVIFVDNAAPLREMSEKSMDEHMKKALEKVYDPKTTYEFKLFHPVHERSDHTRFEAPHKKGH